MPLRRSEAVVLKSIKQGETSKIVTLYTRSAGKIKVLAKGARSARSRFGGTLEPCNYISVLYYDKETRDLQTLSQADIIKPFGRGAPDLQRSVLAMAVCELVDRLEFGPNASPGFFNLIVSALEQISSGDGEPQPGFRAFVMRALQLLGIKPNLSTCLRCGQAHTGRSVRFDMIRGGYVCETCADGRTTGMRLNEEAVRALADLQRIPLAGLNGLTHAPALGRQLDHFLLSYLRYHVEGFRDLNALKVFRRLADDAP